ncbi:MAG: bifunctional diaminohydroxyphosphoribosylaminopyrimidine deaminase/5-amino-6-(5-phosphoribosylamino)uracil reductase RibD [Enterobacteriaceae bacterium]
MRQDTRFMCHAIELARQGRYTTPPNPNVGCVIVNGDQIVGEGFHLCSGDPHAEVHALRMAGEKAKGATVYVTLEPCCHHGKTPPCTDALIAAGVARVVIAMQDPNPLVAGGGSRQLQEAGIAVSCGLLSDEAEALNPGFCKRMRTGLPYVRMKLAASLDGKTAMASGESQWITSAESRQDVQRWRAESSVILSTSATVLTDDPSLTVRWSELDSETQAIYPQERLRQPVRVITDSDNRVTTQCKVLHQPGETWLARHRSSDVDWGDCAVQELLLPHTGQGIDLLALMQLLGSKEINSIWTEAGPTLAGALLQAGLVDELFLYIAPKILGHTARDLCFLPGLKKLQDVPNFRLLDQRQIGPDIRLRLLPEV